MVKKFLWSTSVIACSLLPLAAWGARVSPSGVTASSSYPMDQGVSYDPDKISDGKVSTAWVEGENGSGLGSWVEIDLGGDQSVQKLMLWGGMWYSADYWKRGNRPKDIEVIWSDGTTETFTMANEMKVQELVLATPKSTSKVKIKVKSIYDGTTWLDTAFSEVQVFTGEADAHVAPRAVTASTTLPADGDGNYDPKNVSDGLKDTMWCEGSKSGDGTGDWLDFDFGSARSVSTLQLVNGIGTALPYWTKGNRAATATLKFSDGSTEKITIKNSFMPQTISFPAKTASGVRITFDTVVKGTEYNDLCISEAYFSK